MVNGFLQEATALREKVMKTRKSLERWMRTPELDLRLNNELSLGQMKVSMLYFSACYQMSILDNHRVQPSILWLAAQCLWMSCQLLGAWEGGRYNWKKTAGILNRISYSFSGDATCCSSLLCGWHSLGLSLHDAVQMRFCIPAHPPFTSAKKNRLSVWGSSVQHTIIVQYCKWINCCTLWSPLENTVSLKTKFWLQSPASRIQNGQGAIQTLQTQEIKWHRVWALTYFHWKRNIKMKAYGCLVLLNLSVETWQNAPILGREGDLFYYKALLNLFGYQEADWVSKIHFFSPQQQWLFLCCIYEAMLKSKSGVEEVLLQLLVEPGDCWVVVQKWRVMVLRRLEQRWCINSLWSVPLT